MVINVFGYRYGFNGKENDNEVKGEGNQQDYGMRIYDPRVNRFLSVDPLTPKYPELTPYQFASNRPIDGIDMDGLEYTPAGRYKGVAVDATAVKMYPMHPSVMQQTNAEMLHKRTQEKAAQIIARQPVLKRADNSYEAQQRAKELKQQAAFNKEMGARAASDPISYGGPGMGLGLARDPFVQSTATSVLTGGAGNFVTTQLFQTSTTSLSLSQQLLLKSSIDIGGQALFNGSQNIDFFDAAVAGVPLKPAYSAIGGGMVDIKPFTSDKFKLVGFNKSFSSFSIEATAKYMFGGGGLPGTFKNSYKGSFDLKNISQLRSYDMTNYMIQVPFSLVGKGVSKATKEVVDGNK